MWWPDIYKLNVTASERTIHPLLIIRELEIPQISLDARIHVTFPPLTHHIILLEIAVPRLEGGGRGS